MLPDFCLRKIVAIQPPSDDSGSDSIGWRWDSKRTFTSKSTYSLVVQHPGGSPNIIWKCIWSLQMKVFFIFFETAIRQERLGARLFHLADSIIFSTIHYSIGWRRINAPKLNLGATILCGISVLHQFVGNSGREDVQYCLIEILLIVAASWIIVLYLADLYKDSRRNIREDVSLATPLIRWQTPTVLIAELWAIHDALQRAWDRGLPKINLESDCLDAVRILNEKSTSLLGNGLVATIFKLLRYDWMVSINHINRACNGVVDRLATLSKANNIDDLQLLEPPAEVLSLMQLEVVDFCSL
ncbi:hypothetical protein V6N11_076333 [Hibiscus sabdariffa]|uniref:RNase H type-1 domain-containing protein n=1 Tax=Hibiscus sabdariffa TaxID=183260 RepID=A0ABR2Q5X2_9ROSI